MGLIWGFIFISGIIKFGCDDFDEYYVKYEVNSSTIYVGQELNYVSKNDTPFALKQSDGSDTQRDSVRINYTIDY